jgi:Domain of unknown function (DUF4349)
MRRPEEDMLDPEIVETLDAIDATLAGDPVAPRFAEIAELSLLLSAERPAPGAEFSRALDERAVTRFAQHDPQTPWGLHASLRSWSLGAFGAASAAAAAAIVALVIVLSGGGGPPSSSPLVTRTTAKAPAAAGGAQSLNARSPGATTGAPSSALQSSSSAAAPAQTPSSVQPPTNGRKIVQSALLYLGAPAARVDDVAQQVFTVIGSVNGIVDRSSVTATGGPDGSAQFALRVPSASLAQTMSALSRLRYASVVSRTDNTQDVNTRFVDASRELADAQALRATLVRQLAAATTQGQIDSLKRQLSDAEARIASAQSALRNLNRQVDYSQISLTIQAGAGAGATTGTGSGGGFSLHTAAHDALRVLTVALGAGLIALAVLLPAGLLAGLAWWAAATVRRRRREHALDLA